MRSVIISPFIRSETIERHFVVPTAVFALLFLVLTYGGIDHAVARWLFDLEGGRWALRDAPLLTQGFHRIGKNISTAAWLVTVAVWVWAFRTRKRSSMRATWERALRLIVISVGLATALVAMAKGMSHMDCPWDLMGFGGSKVYVPLLEIDRVNLEAGRCFPAGQASAGYAWISQYFAALMVRPEWRFRGLALGVTFGMILGIAQQLRGAHFLSHDLTTMWICWTVGALVYDAIQGHVTKSAAEARDSQRETIV